MNPITNCQIDAERLAPLTECLETYGIEADYPDELDWPHNVLSTRTVVYSCGQFARSGDQTTHDHDPTEWTLCVRLATAAAALMSGFYIGMGDESEHELSPFYVIANQHQTVPMAITEVEIRSAFGGTLFPQARIEISPFAATAGAWWDYLQTVEEAQRRDTWQNLMTWFASQPELSSPVFVEINLDSFADGHNNNGCVFPRLILGLTPAGSLVGLSSCVVYT